MSKGAAAPCLCPCPSPGCCPPPKKIDGDVYRLMIHMPRCDLLASFLQDNTCDFLAFLNNKQQTNLRLPLHVQNLHVKMFQFQGGFASLPDLRPGALLCPWTPLHLFDAHNNWIKVDIWPHKNYCSVCPGYCPRCHHSPSFRLLALSLRFGRCVVCVSCMRPFRLSAKKWVCCVLACVLLLCRLH